jgi:hypothetical protein
MTASRHYRAYRARLGEGRQKTLPLAAVDPSPPDPPVPAMQAAPAAAAPDRAGQPASAVPPEAAP